VASGACQWCHDWLLRVSGGRLGTRRGAHMYHYSATMWACKATTWHDAIPTKIKGYATYDKVMVQIQIQGPQETT